MTTASVSETKAKLSALLDRVRAGDEVTITDRGVPVAKLVPLAATGVEWEQRLERLEREGAVRRPKRKLDVEWFVRRSLPVAGESVLDALLDERRASGR